MALLTIRQIVVFLVLVLVCVMAFDHSAWEHWYRVLVAPAFMLLTVVGLAYVFWRKN